MNKALFFRVVFYFLAISPSLWGQEVVPITKEEVQQAVAEHNLAIKISEQDFYKAEADYKQTTSVVLPHIGVSYTGLTTTNPLMAFGSKLNQEILTEGDFNPQLLNDPSSISNYALAIEVQQPLINLDGIYQRKAVKTKMEAVALRTTRTKDHLAFEVEQYYMQLQLAYKMVEVLSKTKESALANQKLAEDNFRQGYLQKADVLAVEVRVMEVQNQLQTAGSNVKNISDHLSHLMGEKGNVVFKPADSLSLNVSSETESYQVSKNRADIKALQLSTEAHATVHRASKMSFLPRLNAFGSYQMYDDHPFSADANGYVVGAQLSWNILEGAKRVGLAQKSKAEFKRSELEYAQYVSQSNVEMGKARRMLTDAESHLVLARLAMDHSRESLRIRTNRFREGLEKSADLLLAETQYAQKQLEYYQTVFKFNYALAYIQFLTKV
ncbi:TolC family protein [Fulvivirga sp. M361]|uniref:TolC family protein n=1 Tax=Fulvivirga sp. M361 TaxID=2594266 RepID=UPI00117A660A|nr:TolC family protein [Fulvivirga sp. M361]TRX61862.1 TolC family protein [Fulvivirga sp. M361]